MARPESSKNSPSVFALLRGYMPIVGSLVVVTIVANALSLAIPRIIASAIDSFVSGGFDANALFVLMSGVVFCMFVATYIQNVVQVYASERVARDLRQELADRISVQSYTYVEGVGSAKLLTNLTSDVDAVKNFVAQAIAALVSSLFLIVGASVLLLLTNWRLALVVLAVIPVIGTTFYIILGRVRKLFVQSQEAIDWLNRVINESILGTALIRLLHAEAPQAEKFRAANTQALSIGMRILKLFASLIPVINFMTNLATLAILLLGGRFVVEGSMSLGDFTAFMSYLAILIFPILIIGFMSNVLAQASASYARISEVLRAPGEGVRGGTQAALTGAIEVHNLALFFGEKAALKEVSFSIAPHTRTAIIGPTAAGKTQLLYVMTGLTSPTSGEVLYDGRPLSSYDPASLHSQTALVFQDSVIFNLSVRENIAFSATAKDTDTELAIATAELEDFVKALPDGLNSVISERGSSLSGGQKQRIMLARALALNPKILFLDDFTARVDRQTEAKIIANIARNYPDLTLVSVTQTIAAIEQYDQIVLLMEGEVLAVGTHDVLMRESPEYVQIYESQQSMNQYEL